MTQQPSTVLAARHSIDWEDASKSLAPIACERGGEALKRKSRDYYWFSPILKAALDDVEADLIVMPTNEDELARVMAFCATRRIPLTARGGGTGNYGQAMPLYGGVVVDLSRLNTILWVDADAIRAQAGTKLAAMEQAARQLSRELRFHPSTLKTATVGGFIAGGSTGCGAINYGTLHSNDNVRALRIMTMEAEPRVLELRGAEAQQAVHAYGTNGVIVEVELALAPARRWHDRIVALPTLAAALSLFDLIARDERVGKKQLALLDASTTALLRPLNGVAPVGQHVLVMNIEEATLDVFEAAVGEAGGTIVFAREPDAPGSRMPPLYELGWNHTTLHALVSDRSISYLQVAYPPDYVSAVLAVAAELGDETPLHLEMARPDGELVCFGLPLLRYTTPERLEAVHEVFRRHGCTIFSPHTFVLETGGLQVADPRQSAFRRTSDPFGLMNPGKMPGWQAGFEPNGEADCDADALLSSAPAASTSPT